VEAGQRLHRNDDNLATLFEVINALKALPWFPTAVRDIRAFRVEQWSDLTNILKS
jgi:virulence-associated protein VapD